MTALWEADVVDEKLLLEKCNSEDAKVLKEQWQALCDVGWFPSYYKASFGPNLSLEKELFAMLDRDLGLEDISAVHEECRNKVSEFVAARALYRPLRPNEQRPKVVETAKQLVKSFGGILTPKISLLFG